MTTIYELLSALSQNQVSLHDADDLREGTVFHDLLDQQSFDKGVRRKSAELFFILFNQVRREQGLEEIPLMSFTDMRFIYHFLKTISQKCQAQIDQFFAQFPPEFKKLWLQVKDRGQCMDISSLEQQKKYIKVPIDLVDELEAKQQQQAQVIEILEQEKLRLEEESKAQVERIDMLRSEVEGFLDSVNERDLSHVREKLLKLHQENEELSRSKSQAIQEMQRQIQQRDERHKVQDDLINNHVKTISDLKRRLAVFEQKSSREHREQQLEKEVEQLKRKLQRQQSDNEEKIKIMVDQFQNELQQREAKIYELTSQVQTPAYIQMRSQNQSFIESEICIPQGQTLKEDAILTDFKSANQSFLGPPVAMERSGYRLSTKLAMKNFETYTQPAPTPSIVYDMKDYKSFSSAEKDELIKEMRRIREVECRHFAQQIQQLQEENEELNRMQKIQSLKYLQQQLTEQTQSLIRLSNMLLTEQGERGSPESPKERHYDIQAIMMVFGNNYQQIIDTKDEQLQIVTSLLHQFLSNSFQ